MNTTLAGLLAPENSFWMAAANATQTVLDGGSLFHQMQESKDLYNAAAWSYRGTVIGAVQKRLRCAARVTERRRCAQSRARLRTCRQNQLRPRAAANADWQRECSIAADGADDVPASGHRSGAGTFHAPRRSAALFAALGGGWWNRTAPLPEKTLDVGSGEARPVVERHDGLFEILFPYQTD
jgi:hypothetical protein